ncbi:MAG: L-histidine N(alpha)-methyltransferase [Beijerinckiaceae bacterium]
MGFDGARTLKANEALDWAPAEDEFASAVAEGLSGSPKSLPCRYFYDARGSELFEAITDLPEYYPTRTEAAILAAHASDIADRAPDGAILVEFGSGSSRKTELLLAEMDDLAAYVPIDVSDSALAGAKQRLDARFPALHVHPIVGNFTDEVAYPSDLSSRPKIGFFPGSTIGNLTPDAAADLLATMARALGPDGRLIIGVDLKKDPHRLIAAYNDAAGVTAAFNLNLLARINRELRAEFDLTAFRHEAMYNPREGRIEMYLVSERAQQVGAIGRTFSFAPGERIHTENSYKYSVEEFQTLARNAGWEPAEVWTDKDSLFSVHELAMVEPELRFRSKPSY